MNIRSCIKSMRLRTLPLSLAGVVMGAGIAFSEHHESFGNNSFLTLFFLLFTTCLLQILSNLSNELGDSLHGTDTADRQGIHYSIMDGEMSLAQMRSLIAVVAILCSLSGLAMIFFAFGTLFSIKSLSFILLGACAMVAAVRYTLGKNPYGYRGLGDIFVFIFFGLVSVLGGYAICSDNLPGIIGQPVLPGCAIGFFSVAVLNVNNIRDMDTDRGKRVTMALKMGEKRAREYQTILIVLGWACIISYSALYAQHWTEWLYILTLPLFVLHLRGVWTKSGRDLDKMLPLLVMSTFLLSLIVCTCSSIR